MDTKDIREILSQVSSSYIFSDGCEYELSKFTTYFCSNTEIELKVLGGSIAVSDYFLMYALICMGHATADMVYRYLHKLKKEHQDMIIPGDVTGIRTRLKILSSYGVIRGFEYKVESDSQKGVYIYCIADSGAKLVQRGLYKDCRYDALCSTETISLVLRRVACNYVGTIMFDNPMCKDYMAKTDIYLSKTEKMQTYGRLYYRTGEGENEKKYLVFIEPMFYSYDARIMDSKANISQIAARISNFARHLAFLKDKYTDTALVICIEHWDGFIKSTQLIAQRAPELLQKCYFISDRVLSLMNVNVNGKKIAGCFMSASLTEKDGKSVISYKTAEHPVYFPEQYLIEKDKNS